MSETDDSPLKLEDCFDSKSQVSREEKDQSSVEEPLDPSSAEPSTSFLSVKFDRLHVSDSHAAPPRFQPPPTASETLVVGRKPAKTLSKKLRGKPVLVRGSKLTLCLGGLGERLPPRVFGGGFTDSLAEFSNVSAVGGGKVVAEEVAEAGEHKFDGAAFTNHQRSAGKRKRSNTPELEGNKVSDARLYSCGEQVRLYSDLNPDDLAGYLEDTTFFPKKMSYMAEMMYT